MIKCTCPHCQTPYEIEEDLAGRKLRCDICEEAFIWSSETNTTHPFAPPEPQPTTPPPSHIHKSKSAKKLAAVVLLLIGTTAALTLTLRAKAQRHLTTEHTEDFEAGLARAKSEGKDIVVFQRGSDWNRLAETLYRKVWLADKFRSKLENEFVLLAVDNPEAVGALALEPIHANDDTPARNPNSISPPARLAKLAATPPPLSAVTEVTSEGGATFSRREDGAWVAGGNNPKQDTVTLKVQTREGGRLLRLDFPTDPSLPGTGPGREKKGNFALTEIEADIEGIPTTVEAAWASVDSGKDGPWRAIDGITNQTDKIWSARGNAHQRRTLLLVMKDPLPREKTIILRLQCRSKWGQHVPGCLSAAVLSDPQTEADVRHVSQAQQQQVSYGAFTWWDKAICPRIALLDSEGRAVASENKPRLNLTPKRMAARIRELRAIRKQRDALWSKAKTEQGPRKAELLRQSLDLMGFANWAGNANCYKFIHEQIREADPEDKSGAVRWLSFHSNPCNGVPWAEPKWSQALAGKELTDADYTEALVRIEKELKDPRNAVLDHERIQRIMVAKYHVYKRWPNHQEKRFDVQREIAAFDPTTFWGIGAVGYLGMYHRSTIPMLTYGWAPGQVHSGKHVWDMNDTAYYFDHSGPYKVRMNFSRGADPLTIRYIALLDGNTIISEAHPNAELGPTNKTVEVKLELPEWQADHHLILRVATEALNGRTNTTGTFAVEPQLLPPPASAGLRRSGFNRRKSRADKLLEQGDIQRLQDELADTLAAKSAQTPGGSLTFANDTTLCAEIAQHEVLRSCGVETVTTIAKSEGGAAFLKAFFTDRTWMESFLASDKADFPTALNNLFLLSRYGENLDHPVIRRLATALALKWGNGSRYRLVDRFNHIQRAHREGLMHVTFDSLSVREMRWTTSTAGTAADYQFLLDDRQSRLNDYLGACWAVAYRDNNVYGDSVQAWPYIRPWTHHYGTGHGDRPYPAHRKVGGVCGTLSGYAAAVSRAHGIMSVTVGQPRHCAYIIRRDDKWPVGYSVTWPTSASAPGWDGTGYATLNTLYEPVHADREKFMNAARLTWLARLQTTTEEWIPTYEEAIRAQPTNYGTWIEYIKRLESTNNVPPNIWRDLGRRATGTFALAPEAAWALTRRCLDKVLPAMSPHARMELLLACNRELRQENCENFVAFPPDGILNWQAKKLGNTDLEITYFGKLLGIHHSQDNTKNWIFGKIMNWGTQRFSKKPATAPAYAQAMETFFSGLGDEADNKLVATTIADGIRKASEAGDMESYRIWDDMAAELLPPVTPADIHLNAKQVATIPKYEPFPGDILSKDGMLRTSSACSSDRPLSYRQVLTGGIGGWFDTRNEEEPWAEVLLAGDAELSGLVILNRYEYPATHAEFQWAAPLKVSISSDGKNWTEVATFATAEPVFRVDLQGKELRARHVRIERTPAEDPSAKPGRFHFRNFLIYGKKLY